MPESQQPKIEGECWSDQQGYPENVDGLEHRVEVFGAPYDLSKCGPLQHIQQRIENIRHTPSILRIAST
jgi:hypothetical protein